MGLLPDPNSRPLGSLLLVFTAWKALLLSIALASSVAPDYDTSTSLFLSRLYGPDDSSQPSSRSLSHRLTRWDALYFVHAAREGKVFEQEWAFGVGQSGLVAGLARLLPTVGGSAPEPFFGILLANASHLLGVFALYNLTVLVSRSGRLAFVASALHILSPAGLFLSAPYAESPYSCLTFLGTWLFAVSCNHSRGSLSRNAYIAAAGALFGLATVFRSNGLGNGVLFAVEAVCCLVAFFQRPGLSTCFSMVAPVIGGLCVAAGAVAPQVVAWSRYCGNGSMRPWCDRTIPSIYGFVQEYYWDVGFLRYWTLNQVPLFLLAAPVLGLLFVSGIQVLRDPLATLRLPPMGPDGRFNLLVRTLAATQTFVALLAITNYHVQIINRLASGYLVWYWWIASHILDEKKGGLGSATVVFFVMYAGIQGCLFASFLPPA